jgi:hypothetical protein
LLDAEKGFVAEKHSIQYVTSGRALLPEPQSTSSKQVVVMANPKFDGDLNPNTRMAKNDLPIEGSGVLRGTEKRDVEDLSFEDLGGTQWGRKAVAACRASVEVREFLAMPTE